MANQPIVIDYDRGVIIKHNSVLGMEVYMYRDSPGIYLNAFGTQVPDIIAEQAGFDIELNRKRLTYNQRMHAASKLYKEKLDVDVSKNHKKEVWSGKVFKVFQIGGSGRHIIEDVDGNVLTSGVMLSKDIALEMAKEMERSNAKPASAFEGGENPFDLVDTSLLEDEKGGSKGPQQHKGTVSTAPSASVKDK